MLPRGGRNLFVYALQEVNYQKGGNTHQMNRRLSDYLGIALKGIGMGAADVVPGVSGGTIAFITGIYEELISSIKSINLQAVRRLFQEGFLRFWNSINANFLLALAVGVLFSVFSLAKGIKYLLDTHPILVWSFFFGLILASAFHVAQKISQWSWQVFIALPAGIALAFFITTFTPAETPASWWFVLISGAIAICAMILPGISGSFILILLGKYAFMMHAISNLQWGIIAIFAVGAGIGLISFANLLSWLLNRFYNVTIAVLAGFMLGSLNKVWPWKETLENMVNRHGETVPKIQQNVLPGTFEQVSGTDAQLLFASGLFALGILVIVFIEWISARGKKSGNS